MKKHAREHLQCTRPFPDRARSKRTVGKATHVASGLIEDSEQDVGVGDDDDEQRHHVDDHLKRKDLLRKVASQDDFNQGNDVIKTLG